jgi:hypothetical protein
MVQSPYLGRDGSYQPQNRKQPDQYSPGADEEERNSEKEVLGEAVFMVRTLLVKGANLRGGQLHHSVSARPCKS